MIERSQTERVRREHRKPAVESDDGAIQAEPVLDDAEETDDDAPQFSDESLAALLFGDQNDQDYGSQFCTIHIRRHPDSMNDRFLTPCGALTKLPPLRNVELAAERMDIEERVRNEYGGGHYFFQIYFDGALGKSWKATLSDDPAAVARARAEAVGRSNNSQPQPTSVPPVDPVQAFLDGMLKQRQLKDALFGDDEKRLEREIADLRAEVAKQAANPAEPKSERIALLEMAMDSKNSDARDRLLNHVFPSEEKGGRHWIADTIEVVLENKDVILGVLGSLLGGIAPPQPSPQPSIQELMRAAPPTGAAMPTGLSQFKRKPLGEPQQNGEVEQIDAEPVETDFPELDLSDMTGQSEQSVIDADAFDTVDSFTPPAGDEDFAPVSELAVGKDDGKRPKRTRKARAAK